MKRLAPILIALLYLSPFAASAAIQPTDTIYCVSAIAGTITLGIDNLDAIIIHPDNGDRTRRVESVYGRSLLKQTFRAGGNPDKHGPQNCRVETQHMDCLVKTTVDPADVTLSPSKCQPGSPPEDCTISTSRIAEYEAALRPRENEFSLNINSDEDQEITIDGTPFTCNTDASPFNEIQARYR